MLTYWIGLQTLILDSSFKPVALIPVQAAVARIAAMLVGNYSGRVQVVAVDETRRFRSALLDLPAPLIIATSVFVKPEHLQIGKVVRPALFARDNYTCQYCGLIAETTRVRKQLTIDHVRPARLFKSRAEATSWENCVTACHDCNNRKGGRLPSECQMAPKNPPLKPNYAELRFADQLNQTQHDYVAALARPVER